MTTTTTTAATTTISSAPFYAHYSGHPLPSLHALHAALPTPRIYLCGDSTLDNKHWLPPPSHPAPLPYRPYLQPPLAARDLAYWLTLLAPPHRPYTALNCAVEESTLRARAARLLPHDAFAAATLHARDVLVVSVGANDVALGADWRAALDVARAVYAGGGGSGGGGGGGGGGGWGVRGRDAVRRGSALEALFGRELQRYVRRLVRRCRPRLVVLCALYYLDEARGASWAGPVLRVLLYDWRPQRLQRVVREVRRVMDGVTVPGVRVVVAPVYEALDGKVSADYVQRVEPSEEGGRKMARFLWTVIDRELCREEEEEEEEEDARRR